MTDPTVKRSPRKRLEESDWDWLLRCNGDDAVGQAVGVIEELLGKCPSKWETELRARLKAKAKNSFDSAFFELFLYELLSNTQGLHVEPIVERDNPNQPDLLVRDEDGNSAYIEATVITNQEAEQAQDHRAYELLLDCSKYVESTDWRYWITGFQATTTPPSTKRFARILNEWLSTLNQGEVRLRVKEHGFELRAMPHTTLYDSKSGWKISLHAFPTPIPEATPSRPTADGSFGIFSTQLHQRLIRAVDSKLIQHRAIREQVIVAVTCNHAPGDPDEEDCLTALLGNSYCTLNRFTGEQTGQGRKANGLWNRPNRSLDVPPALIIASCVLPWKLPVRDLRVWHNPWYSGQLPDLPFPSNGWDKDTGEFWKRDGRPYLT